MNPIVVEFNFRNSTKGAQRFEEDVPEDQGEAKVGGLYVRKWTMPQAPARVRVTIEEV